MQHFARRATALRFSTATASSIAYRSRCAFASPSANFISLAFCNHSTNQFAKFCTSAKTKPKPAEIVEEKKSLEIYPLPDGVSGDRFQLLDIGGTEVGDDGQVTVLAVHGPPELWSRHEEPLYGANGGIFAVIEAGGTQHKVCADNALYLNRIQGEVNTQVVFDKVLLLGTVGWTAFGRPYIGGARVLATIEEQTLSGKVMVTKFKKRKGYMRRKGHRQNVTRVRINEVQFQFPSKELITPHEIELDPLRPPMPNSPRWFM